MYEGEDELLWGIASIMCYSSSDAAPPLLRFFDLRSASRSVTRTPYFDSVCGEFMSAALRA